MPWFAALPLGVLIAGLAAAVIGWFATRTRGIYFAMVTLGLSGRLHIVFQWVSLTGGEDGLRGVNVPAVDLFGLRINLLDPTTKYYVILVFVAGALALFSRILNSPFGAVIEALRENERRARACGYDVTRVRCLLRPVRPVSASPARSTPSTCPSCRSRRCTTSTPPTCSMTLLGGMGTFFGPFSAPSSSCCRT